MKTDRFYKIVIVLLLVLNGGTLAYLLKGSGNDGPGHHMPPPNRGKPVDHLIRERLALDEEQEEQFRQLKEEHHGQMLEIQKEERELHTSLFALLKTSLTDTVRKAELMEQLKANDSRKEEVTFEHFRKLRLILTPEQQPRFDELMEEISRQILSHHRDRRQGEGPPPPDMP